MPHDGIDLQVIPSCGMKLHPSAVAARTGGWVFNCDGEYPLGAPADAGAGRRNVVEGVDCTFADYVNSDNPVYGAHTQLALVEAGPEQGEPRMPGARDARFAPAPDVAVTVIALDPIAELAGSFAGGPGALHIYGRETPLPLRG